MLKDLLETRHCFKLVCGAGNEDIEEVKRLVYLYAIAGCRFFDLSANEEVISVAREALNLAKVYDAYLCVSVGIKNDPHVNKAVIDYDRCVNCEICEEICPQNAIHQAKVERRKCIGCGKCWKVCSRAAISYISEEKNLNEVLPQIVEKGIDCIEFHAMGLNTDEIYSKWKYLNDNYEGLLSICTSRGQLSDERLVARIKKMINTRADFTTIIQADGFPMSGGDDNYKSTLQAVATAEIVTNAQLPVYIMLSGGTNRKTTELAQMCEIPYHGVAVGSYARKIVKKYINSPDFWTNPKILTEALELVKPLIDSVIL